MKQDKASQAKQKSQAENKLAGDFVSSKATFYKMLRVIARYRGWLVASILLAAVTVIGQLYIPILFGNAIDDIVAKHRVDFAAMVPILWRIGILTAITAGLTWVMNVVNNHLTFHVVQDIRGRAIRQIQHLPLKTLDAHSTGDMVSRVIADVDQLSNGLLLGFTQLFSGVMTIVVTLIFMFQKSWIVTLIVIAMTPLSFIVAKFIATHSYALFRKQSEIRGQQTALIEAMVGGEKVVKAFGYGDRASKRFDTINRDLQDASVKAIFYSSLTNPSTRAINALIYAIVALAGAFLIFGGSLTVGGLSVILNYSNQYMKPFNDISSVITELQNALACAARVFALIDAAPETPDPDNTLPDVKGAVDFNHVYFSYTKSHPLIEDFNLSAKPGMTVAIVGPTGCGKTTLINLMMRFYDVDRGSICFDGVDTATVTRHSLRHNIGMVLQETWLMAGTIRENITFGKPDATDEEIIAAAKKAHSWEFIRRFPKGLGSFVTDGSLSQGQKQLLCITRVMLAPPDVLILDEATSSIDTRTELLVQNAFDRLMAGRTSFIVAHRLSTIRNADIILVMRDGKIIETGNHDTLMAQNGFYTHLYNSQFAGQEQ